MSDALHDQALDRYTAEEIAHRRLLMLAMKAWITEEIGRLESLQPAELRTPAPAATTATPTCDGPAIVPTRTEQPESTAAPLPTILRITPILDSAAAQTASG